MHFQDQSSRIRNKGHFLMNKEALSIQYTLPSTSEILLPLANLLKKGFVFDFNPYDPIHYSLLQKL